VVAEEAGGVVHGELLLEHGVRREFGIMTGKLLRWRRGEVCISIRKSRRRSR
jgi:hypothetical protein